MEGNYQYSDAYLKETFAAHGLSPGTHIASFDRSAFSAEYLRTQEELSYLSVNFRGSVAYVQVLERFATPKESQKTGAANLIARTDGVIRSLSVKTGDPLVHAGSVVRAGDPLVSGVQQGAGGDFFVYAEGEVIARVSHTLTLKIPKNQLRKTRGKGALVGFTLKFFEKEINIRLGASNSGSIYDTIYKNKSFYVTDTCRLPFSLGFSYAAIEREQTISLSDTQTASYASRCMDAKLAVFLQDKELLSKRVYGAFEGEYYVITCEIECLENIAVTQEFTVD